MNYPKPVSLHGCFVEPVTHMISLTNTDGVPRLGIDFRRGNGITWVILQGEADIATLEDLGTALDHVELDGAESVHLHVTALDFVDVATMRRLTLFARRAGRAGHSIMTCGANPTFRTLARLLGARADLGLL